MAGIGEAASIIAIIQISEELANLCLKYSISVKNARSEIQRLRAEVISLQDVLTNVQDLASAPGSANLTTIRLLNVSDGPVHELKADLEGLIEKLSPGQQKGMRRYGITALKWPFTKKDIEHTIEAMERQKSIFSLALISDNAGLAQAIKSEVSYMRYEISQLGIGQSDTQAIQAELLAGQNQRRKEKILERLQAPDPSSNHQAASRKHTPTTGTWFTTSIQFENWTAIDNSFLWIHGIPGCGKSILCSTIINHVKSKYGSDPSNAIAYFYFDFNDQVKQNHENMLRSLLRQLYTQCQSPEIMKEMDKIFTNNPWQIPPLEICLSMLQSLIQDFGQTFLLIDALDECTERDDLLGWLEDIMSLKAKKDGSAWKLHILTTSRREPDIELVFGPLVTCQICMQDEIVNADILVYVQERLQNDTKLKARKFPSDVQIEIEVALMKGACGMFRWVVCQLDELGKCLTLPSLRKALKSMPKTLDETYERIISNIHEDYRDFALTILRWLAYSARPLYLNEVAEILAINLNTQDFDPERRLLNSQDILTICSTLVTTRLPAEEGHRYYSDSYDSDANDSNPILRLAHFSVKEFLISDRILTGSASRFGIERNSNHLIAQGCLIYLLYFEGPKLLTSNTIKDYPLADYAAEFWFQHTRDTHVTEILQDLGMKLLTSEDTFLNCNRIFDPHFRFKRRFDYTISDCASPLLYVSICGVTHFCDQLLKAGTGVDVNSHVEGYSTALQAASSYGRVEVVKLLISAGADVNFQDEGEYGTALQIASFTGHADIVKLLIDAGADVNARVNRYSTPVQKASVAGHADIVKLLIDAGANVNAQGGIYGNALQVASRRGHKSVVMLLVDAGAEGLDS